MAERSTANIASITINASAVVLGIAGLAVLIGTALSRGALTAATVYGITLVLAYGSSTLFHLLRHSVQGPLFQTLDHCTIYLLIAGTYTPLAVLAMGGTQGLVLLCTVWILAFLGVAVRVLWIRQLHRAAPALYVLLGWIGVGWAESFVTTLERTPLVLLLAGAVAYTGGAAIVSLGRSASGDVLWHLCAVTGSACHFAAILSLLTGHGVEGRTGYSPFGECGSRLTGD